MFVRILWRGLTLLVLLAAGWAPAQAGPALLYDTQGDRVIYAEDADQPWFAASLTKMMTAYLVFEAWKDGRATKETKLTISPKANAQAKMRLGLGAGKELTYDDAVKALIIVSANDIAYALAEAVGGTEEAFVAEMNAKADKLGMTGTRFINPHGLPGDGQHTTAQDMARIAAALMRDFPEHMAYFGLTTTEIGDKHKRMIATHNPVLVTFEGGDGMKTGFTCSAGYNIVASASRDGHRLVAVVLGEESSAKRAVKTNAMLEYGFKIMAWKALFPAATIHSLPAGFYDRGQIKTANLDKRYTDCKDPEPAAAPVTQSAATGSAASPAAGSATATAATAAAAASAPVTTGSIGSKKPKSAMASVTGAAASSGSEPAPKVVLKAGLKRRANKTAARRAEGVPAAVTAP